MRAARQNLRRECLTRSLRTFARFMTALHTRLAEASCVPFMRKYLSASAMQSFMLIMIFRLNLELAISNLGSAFLLSLGFRMRHRRAWVMLGKICAALYCGLI